MLAIAGHVGPHVCARVAPSAALVGVLEQLIHVIVAEPEVVAHFVDQHVCDQFSKIDIAALESMPRLERVAEVRERRAKFGAAHGVTKIDGRTLRGKR